MKFSPIFVSLLVLATGCNKSKDKKETGTTEPVTETAEGDKKETTAPEGETTADTATDETLLERGTYLANIMGCEQCHTPLGPKGPVTEKAWAGGLEVPEVFGTWRSPNITQDKETGIGSWSDDEIIAAIRTGVRPDGERLYPIMPYMFYSVMSDDDAKALVAYLRTVEGISNKVERAELPLPKPPAPPSDGKAPEPSNGADYGGYLASLMHCAACHTPMTEKGPDMSKAFAGGMVFEIPQLGEGKLYSSNLTPHETGLKDWSPEEIATAIRQMKKRDGSLIVGPMALYQRGWYALEDRDVEAIVAFLGTLPPTENKIPESDFKPHAAPPAPPK